MFQNAFEYLCENPRAWPVIAALAFVVQYVIIAFKNLFTSPLRHIPGPWHTRVSSLPLKLATISGKKIYFIHSLHETYGPIVRISLTEVSVNDPYASREIHRVGTKFTKAQWYTDLDIFKRPGIFSTRSNAEHAVKRKMFSRAFSEKALRENWEGVVLEKTKLAVSRICEDAARGGGKVDVMKWWMFYSTDVSTHLMFGESFHALERGDSSEFTRITQNMLKGSGISVELPWLATFLRLLLVPSVQELFGGERILLRYSTRAVDNMKSVDGGTNSARNIFARLAEESEKGDERLSDLDVKIEAMNLIVAGADTTGVTLTYLTWVILKHPHIRERLLREIETLPEEPRDVQLEKLPYLNATIQEVLRLYGAAPGGLPRTVPVGGAMLCGKMLPEGATVMTQSYSAHRDPKNFENPDLFDPTRWLPENADKLSERAKLAFAPLGTGSRACLGMHLATMELRLAIVLFLRACPTARVAPSTKDEDMEMENYFLVAPKAHRCDIIL